MTSSPDITRLIQTLDHTRSLANQPDPDLHDTLLRSLANTPALGPSDTLAKLKEFAWLYWAGSKPSEDLLAEDLLLISLIEDLQSIAEC